MATTTTTTHHSARPGRTITAVIAGLALVALAYEATNPNWSQTGDGQSANSAPAAITPAADPFQVMADLTPVVSNHLGSTTVEADPFQAARDLTPLLSAYLSDTDS